MTRLTFVTRAGCHLCEAAREQLDEVIAAAGTARPDVEVVDVDSDPEVRSEYGDQVPVVLLDGALHSYFRIDADRLLRALQDRDSAPTHR